MTVDYKIIPNIYDVIFGIIIRCILSYFYFLCKIRKGDEYGYY